jgi:hypothetical protein
VERKLDPNDYLKSPEEQEEVLNKIVHKFTDINRDKSQRTYEVYNGRKNFFYGLLFGGVGIVYKRQMTLWIQQQNRPVYSRLILTPLPILTYYIFCGLHDSMFTSDIQERLKEDFLGLLAIKVAIDTLSIILYDNAMKEIRGKINTNGNPNELGGSKYYGGIRAGLALAWIYILIGKYHNRKPLGVY